MNILFIGPYRQNDGWGSSSKDYLGTLSELKEHTISSAPIYMSQNIDKNIPYNLLSAEKTYCDKFDVIIQKTLPNYFHKLPGYNIGIYTTETNSMDKSVFIEHINVLDELWTTSELDKTILKEAGVTIPIVVIPEPVNTTILKACNTIEPFPIPNIDNSFNFYMIADTSERKNIEAAIIAFNREFHNTHDVKFILKTSGIAPQNLQQKILELKNGLRLFSQSQLYANEILITDNIEPVQMMSLHKSGDCLLITSRGESYCKPALDSLYFGNQVICTDNIHTSKILGDKCVAVESMEVPINIKQAPAPHIYTGWETWYDISILDLQKKMREAYELGKTKQDNKQWIEDNFSYSAVANKMKDRLCQLSLT